MRVRILPDLRFFGCGTDLLLLPMPGGLTTITTHQRADIVDVQGDAGGGA